ncbi:hypothetical protein [Demequina sp. NBRC 110051]|uniref:hypothetical protein n=1 Tax=Demequina sp. NBRC 110051 TaxID=1570340 RepID=UPI003529E9AE
MSIVPASHGARAVDLPAGARWTEIATGEVHEGGTMAPAAAPLDVIPVFARDGRAHGVTLPS